MYIILYTIMYRIVSLNILYDKKIILAVQNLVKLYDNDLDDQLGNELIQVFLPRVFKR